MNFEQMIGDSELKLYVIASGISHINKKLLLMTISIDKW